MAEIKNKGKKSVSLKDKQLAIKELDKPENINPKTKQPNFYKVSKVLYIQRVQLIKWYKNKEDIMKTHSKQARRRLSPKLSRAEHKEMEIELDKWAKSHREKGCLLSSFTLKVKAIEIERDICSKNGLVFKFFASDGWFRNFLKRHDYTLRRITTSGRDLPTDCLKIIEKFLTECEQMFMNDHVRLNQIVNMDETNAFLDAFSNYSYAKKGSKRVKAVTSGNERTRMSAAYSAIASGIKLPIFLIFPRKTEKNSCTNKIRTSYKKDSKIKSTCT